MTRDAGEGYGMEPAGEGYVMEPAGEGYGMDSDGDGYGMEAAGEVCAMEPAGMAMERSRTGGFRTPRRHGRRSPPPLGTAGSGPSGVSPGAALSGRVAGYGT